MGVLIFFLISFGRSLFRFLNSEEATTMLTQGVVEPTTCNFTLRLVNG